jgi:hypothetical protein
MFPFGNMLFPMLTAVWLHQLLYFSSEDHKSRQNIIILFRKYLVDIVDIISEAWLNFFWEYIKIKLFAVFAYPPIPLNQGSNGFTQVKY